MPGRAVVSTLKEKGLAALFTPWNSERHEDDAAADTPADDLPAGRGGRAGCLLPAACAPYLTGGCGCALTARALVVDVADPLGDAT